MQTIIEKLKENTPKSNTEIKLLINGICENVFDCGDTFLHLAAFYNNVDICDYLLDKVHINKVNNNGETALYHACLNNSVEAVKLLVENFADPTIKGGYFNLYPKNVSTNQKIQEYLQIAESYVPIDGYKTVSFKIKPEFSMLTVFRYRYYMLYLEFLNSQKIRTRDLEKLYDFLKLLHRNFINSYNNDGVCCCVCGNKPLIICRCKKLNYCSKACENIAFSVHSIDCI